MSQNTTETTAITLRNTANDGVPLEATFLPSHGMNMISYKKGDLEVIDPSTKNLFDERFAGLGALIGPHFHRRHPGILPVIQDPSRFPHIARVAAKGVQDPFSHGIARYAPWNFEVTDNIITGTLTGKDKWNDVPLAELEGQQFKMTFKAELKSNGLHLDLSVVSDTDSLVGIHYYYHLPTGKGRVISNVQKECLFEGKMQPIPFGSKDHALTFDLAHEADHTFYPFPHPREGSILLDAETYRLQTKYTCVSQENSWQLYHPKGASFVCIEPLSSQDPRHPNLTVSSLSIHLEIF